MALFAEGKLFREAGTGSGGGDKHNKGYFVDESALTTAYPTAEAGDYAIVESTDTVWIWDSDNSEWKDSDQKGQVTSVNGQTGDVVIPTAPTYTAGTGIDITNGVVSLAGADDDIPLDDYPCMIVATKDSVTSEVYTEWTTGYVRHINGMDQDVELNPQTLPAVWSMDDPNYPYVYADKIVQYQYQDDATLGLTEGYFYKSVEDATKPEDVEIDAVNAAELTDVTITNKPYLIRVCKHYFGYEDNILRFEYRSDSGRWWNLEDETSVGINLTNVGITYLGTPQDGDTIEVAYTAQGWKWQQINVQPSSVPTDPAFNSITLSGTTSYRIGAASSYYLRIGTGTTASNYDLFIKTGSGSSATMNIAFGTAGGEVGASTAKMGRVYTTKINNGADIAVPTTGGTMAVIGVNTTATLTAADWSSNTQTVSITGMTANGVVFVSPTPANQSAYTSAGILCTAQAAGTLTFTCDTVPSADITVTVVML